MSGERERTDARRYRGGARKEFIATVAKLASEVRQGRSPSECWREVDAAIAAMGQRLPQAQGRGAE
jgi:hypothetical protein